jgi:hypothetical protein
VAFVTFPHTFADGPGNVASGVQVMENLNALKTAVEALAGVGKTYEAEKTTADGEEHEPSTTQPALVTVWATMNASSGLEVLVGGKRVGAIATSAAPPTITSQLGPFLVPAGVKWKAVKISAYPFEVHYTQVIL